uniref:Uncharacterized protein n=1 Tax=Arion vulgaris TaxID=1028688 RepID=A0A0B7ASX8_9EUPU
MAVERVKLIFTKYSRQGGMPFLQRHQATWGKGSAMKSMYMYILVLLKGT